ncbi:sulfotransferase domain-containing protein [Synechococcus sp. PCC 7336]|uniref:sulfotransferase domain-containing protein n=1 Tax=Synechococcus sp. PCC 7336 TaxID=195250 RepID=UPI00034D0E20|nr:sulfotransferase domain-containing protein [Synechococcus sp. PCC 7336]
MIDTLSLHSAQHSSAAAAAPASPLNYVLIAGPGRSGTTWLCQILNTYEHCLLKYEPFLSAKPSPYTDWKDDLARGEVRELRDRFDALCRDCHMAVDLPPFPAKSFRQQSSQLLHLLFGAGKRLDALKFLYETYGRVPLTSATPVLIKEVNFPSYLFPKLCEVLNPMTISTVRNPFATLASFLKGRELGLHSHNDRSQLMARVRQGIDSLAGVYLSEYRDRLADLSETQLHTLNWRLLAEPLVDYTLRNPRAGVLVYEDLCRDPQATVASLFEFLGWELGAATRAFVDRTRAGDRKFRSQSKAYFSVYRDSKTTLDKWQKQLSKQQKDDIASIVRDSPLMVMWPQLELSV